MTAIPFINGPKDTAKTGDTYTLEPGQSPPTEYRHKEWKGHYVLLGGRFVWKER